MSEDKTNMQNATKPQSNEPLIAKKSAISLVSTVWLIPLVAIIIGLWIWADYVRNTGLEITLYLKNGDGLTEGSTYIKMLDVNVGKITSISLNQDKTSDDDDGVVLKAKMSKEVNSMLKKDTKFWVVKPRIDQTGITGLSTLISGSYIQMYPGSSEQNQTTFTVADVPPTGSSTSQGLHIKLVGQSDRMLSVGAPVVYRNITVGNVEFVDFDPIKKQVNYQIFISKPNHILVNKNANFWLSSGLDISLNRKGLQVNQLSLGNLLNGAIEFDTADNADGEESVVNNTQFKLFSSKKDVPTIINKNSLYVVAWFKQSIASLEAGSSVEYKGVKVGEVAQTPYFVGNDKTKLFIRKAVPVLFYIDPSNFNITDNVALDKWKKQFNTTLVNLQASLASESLLTGGQYIELIEGKKNNDAFKLGNSYANYPVIATVGGGFDEIQNNLSQLLSKLTNLPLENTFKQVNTNLVQLQQTLNSLNAMLADSSTKALPNELQKTMQQLQQMLSGISPNAAVYQNLQQLLPQLEQTLHQAQPLLQQLNEQPNALIFNKSQHDPLPKGYKP